METSKVSIRMTRKLIYSNYNEKSSISENDFIQNTRSLYQPFYQLTILIIGHEEQESDHVMFIEFFIQKHRTSGISTGHASIIL